MNLKLTTVFSICVFTAASASLAGCSGESSDKQSTVSTATSAPVTGKESKGHLQDLLAYPTKNLKQALAEYRPRSSEGHAPTAKVYFDAAVKAMQVRDYESGEILLDESIRLNPNNGLAYYERGRARCNTFNQKDKEALADLDKAIRLGVATANVYEFKARIYDGLKQRDKAIDALTEAIILSPRDQRFYRWRASLYSDAGQKKLAQADYDKAIFVDPHNSYLYLLRAQLHESMGLYEDALHDYAKGSEYDTGNDRLLKRGVALKNWAILLGKLGRYKEAIAILNREMEMDKTDDEVIKLRGDNLYALKKYDEAIKDYSRSIELGPSSSGSVFLSRSKAYQAIGRADLAQKDLAEAKKLNDSPAEKHLYDFK